MPYILYWDGALCTYTFFICSELSTIVNAAASIFTGLVIRDYANTQFHEMGDIGDSYLVSSAYSS